MTSGTRIRTGSIASRSFLAASLVLVGLLSVSCGRSTPPPPPDTAAAPPPAPPPAPAPTITLTATPDSITAGQSAMLEWESTNAAGVEIEPGIGAVQVNGSRMVSPSSSVTYIATATGPGGTATAPARVTVEAAEAAPPPLPDRPDASIEDLFRTNVQTIYFDYDRSEVRADQVSRLQGNARFLQQNPEVQFVISGHADERGSQEYNIGLGDRRANSVRQFLIQQGIAASRINTITYGEDRPVCTQPNEDCWQQNRRAEFALR